jgi:hypothetical protein
MPSACRKFCVVGTHSSRAQRARAQRSAHLQRREQQVAHVVGRRAVGNAEHGLGPVASEAIEETRRAVGDARLGGEHVGVAAHAHQRQLDHRRALIPQALQVAREQRVKHRVGHTLELLVEVLEQF